MKNKCERTTVFFILWSECGIFEKVDGGLLFLYLSLDYVTLEPNYFYILFTLIWYEANSWIPGIYIIFQDFSASFVARSLHENRILIFRIISLVFYRLSIFLAPPRSLSPWQVPHLSRSRCDLITTLPNRAIVLTRIFLTLEVSIACDESFQNQKLFEINNDPAKTRKCGYSFDWTWNFDGYKKVVQKIFRIWGHKKWNFCL